MKKNNIIVFGLIVLYYTLIFICYFIIKDHVILNDTISSSDNISSEIRYDDEIIIDEYGAIDYLERTYFLGTMSYNLDYSLKEYNLSQMDNNYYLEAAIKNSTFYQESFPNGVPTNVINEGINMVFGKITYNHNSFTKKIDNCSLNVTYKSN